MSLRLGGRLRSCVAIVLLAATSQLCAPQALRAQVAPEALQQGDIAADTASFNALVAEAVDRFRAADYTSALERFDRAIAIAPADADIATLHFNSAASLYELQRFAAAEQRFERAADLSGVLAPLARLNAGMAALRDRRTQAAAQHLALAPPGDAEAEARRAELAGLLDDATRAAQEDAFARELKLGVKLYAAGELWSARKAFERCLAAQRGAMATDKAFVHVTLAQIAYELGDFAAARRSVQDALAQDPDNAEAHVTRAELALQADDAATAEQAARRALALETNGATAARAQRVLRRLDQLPPAGPSFVLTLGGGYDSNASQSGSAELAGAAGLGSPQASWFATAGIQLDYTLRPSGVTAVVPYYLGDFYAPTAAALQSLAFQGHEVGAHLQLALGRVLQLRLTAGTALVFSGLDPMQPFTWEGVFGTRATLTTGRATTTSLDLTARPSRGLSQQDYLSGSTLDASLEERTRLGSVRLAIGAGYRYSSRGGQEIAIDQPDCQRGPCNNQAYVVPLGYHGPWARVGALVELFERLAIGANAKLEYRSYLDPNWVRGIPASRKTRADMRYRLRGYTELSLDSAEHLSVLASYEALISRSNIAYDPNSSEHRYDYGDRNFVQHVIDLALELRW